MPSPRPPLFCQLLYPSFGSRVHGSRSKNRGHCRRTNMNQVCLWILFVFVSWLPAVALAGHDTTFWKQIRATKFAVPPNESLEKLALEMIDLTGNADHILRDECG